MPTLVAHRGLHLNHPENSIGAFLAAWKHFEWCECDIRLTSDGMPIVFHDETLERTSTGSGSVAAATWAAICELRLRDESGAVTTERIPSLAMVLDAMPSSARMLVEIKPGYSSPQVEKVLRLLNPRQCSVQSFDADVMDVVSRGDTRFATGYLLGEKSALLEDKNTDFGLCGSINIDHRALTPERVDRIHACGKQVGAWTCNEPAQAAGLRAMGVETLISDRPDLVSATFLGK